MCDTPQTDHEDFCSGGPDGYGLMMVVSAAFAQKLERELEEAGEVIEDLKADNIRLGARLDSRTESGALEYASLHDEVMRLRAAARAAAKEEK